MRFIFIVLFLISFGSLSMGGVGDVYFCNKIVNKWYRGFTEKVEMELNTLKFKIENKRVIVEHKFFDEKERLEMIILNYNQKTDEVYCCHCIRYSSYCRL